MRGRRQARVRHPGGNFGSMERMNKLALSALLGLSVALSSCGPNGSTEVPKNTPPETKISGHIATWPGGGTVTLKGAVLPLASAPVDAASNFTLALPTEGAALTAELRPVTTTVVGGLGQFGCQNVNLTNSNAAAQGLLVSSLRAQSGASGKDLLAANTATTLTSRTVDARAWLYVDQDTTLSGSVSCTLPGRGSFPVNVKVDAVRGWNMLQFYVYGSYGFGGLTISGEVKRSVTPVSNWITMDELNAAIQ